MSNNNCIPPSKSFEEASYELQKALAQNLDWAEPIYTYYKGIKEIISGGDYNSKKV
jgi:hypothetical protein